MTPMFTDPELSASEVQFSLEQLDGLFKRGVKITFIARDPATGEHLIMGTDAALKIALERYITQSTDRPATPEG